MHKRGLVRLVRFSGQIIANYNACDLARGRFCSHAAFNECSDSFERIHILFTQRHPTKLSRIRESRSAATGAQPTLQLRPKFRKGNWIEVRADMLTAWLRAQGSGQFSRFNAPTRLVNHANALGLGASDIYPLRHGFTLSLADRNC